MVFGQVYALKVKVQRLEVKNNEKDIIIKSQEEEIRRLKEEVDSLIKKRTFKGKSFSLSEPPLTLQDINQQVYVDARSDEDSNDMVPII